jgi:uncharacterized membrane-anchored protein
MDAARRESRPTRLYHYLYHSRNLLAFDLNSGTSSGMALLTEPVTLSTEQIKDLSQKLAVMRHDINNYLSLVLAGTELARQKPDMMNRMMDTLAQQPLRITEAMRKFSEEFEKTFGITRP